MNVKKERTKYNFDFHCDVREVDTVVMLQKETTQIMMELRTKNNLKEEALIMMDLTDKRLKNLLDMFKIEDSSELLGKDMKILWLGTKPIGIAKAEGDIYDEYLTVKYNEEFPFERKTHICCINAYLDAYMDVYNIGSF